MVEPRTVSVRLVVFCDTAFHTVCFFTGIELGIPRCTSLLTYKYCVCLSVCLSILHFLENIVVREGKNIRS